MARRKRRSRTQHAGVKLRQRTTPGGGKDWRAHWTNPATGREKAFTLDAALFSTKEAREAWARDKAQALARARADFAAGKTRPTKTPLPEAITNYLGANNQRLKSRTLHDYTQALDLFAAWCAEHGVAHLEALTPEQLARYRESRLCAPSLKPRQGQGVGRGARKAAKQRRGPRTINRELRSLVTALRHWRRLGLLPKVSRDDITDRLAKEREPTPQPRPLKGTEPAALLAAVLRHDAARFAETRAEHRGEGAPGSTPRYEVVAPLTVFLLLSGCRAGEARALKWRDVDLDAPGNDGEPMGLVTVAAAKTGRAREIAFDITPTLRPLLAALKLRAGAAPYVFGDHAALRPHRIKLAVKRLQRDFGAPAFSPQTLRQAAGCFLTCAPGIFGSASVFMSAARLGHGVQVAQRHYLGAIRGIPREARTLEAAMGIEAEMAALLAAVRGEDADHVAKKA